MAEVVVNWRWALMMALDGQRVAGGNQPKLPLAALMVPSRRLDAPLVVEVLQLDVGVQVLVLTECDLVQAHAFEATDELGSGRHEVCHGQGPFVLGNVDDLDVSAAEGVAHVKWLSLLAHRAVNRPSPALLGGRADWLQAGLAGWLHLDQMRCVPVAFDHVSC